MKYGNRTQAFEPYVSLTVTGSVTQTMNRGDFTIYTGYYKAEEIYRSFEQQVHSNANTFSEDLFRNYPNRTLCVF